MQVILAVVEGLPSDRSVLHLAHLAAGDADAHIDVLSSLPEPRDSIPVVGEGLSGEIVERLMREAEEDIAKLRKNARSAYDAFLAGGQMREAEHPDRQPGGTVCWREATGRPADVVPSEGRFADLVIAARVAPPRTDSGVVEAAIFGGGRPVLMAPPDPISAFGKRVAVFWNGSTEAARAVAAALPLLRRAEQVQVLTLNEHPGRDGGPHGLERYLAWHGIAAASRLIERDHRDAGDALLEEAQNDGADLVVMGAYTHSRLRQMILGGVTTQMLEQSPLPVLMCH